ncbi:MAG: protoporphyrinogen oxidase [Marivirga sp.]|jgi:protoporphyrinogen oxidase
MQEEKIIIIGAGVAGLVAAIELEKAGFKPTIVEASDSIGGRIKTDKYEGFLLDHGFQVLLTAYPEAQRYLDYSALKLNKFDPGAFIFTNSGQRIVIGDPLRQPSQLFSTIFSSAGTIFDKWKIFRWSTALKKVTVEDIFKRKEMTSLKYLREKGFSDRIIEQFFKPFFGGIFLENELSTSSRMLEFVFKMFSEGHAAIPSNGMQEIPKMLYEQLTQTELILNSEVNKIGPSMVCLKNGKELKADAIVIATDPSKILPQLQGQVNEYQKAINMYFSLASIPYRDSLIALVPDQNKRINNFCFIDNTASSYTAKNRHLLSVSINDDRNMSEHALRTKVIEELIELIPEISEAEICHLKTYYIVKALPKLADFQYSMKSSNTKVQEGVYLAGDYLLNGSINAAMLSGRLAAQAIFEDLKGKGFRS